MNRKRYQFANNLSGWIAFAIASVTYLLTIEPTASFWDCGEFISTAYKLDVGHPPGAPFFMLFGRFFANFASGPEQVAAMINTMSALFSGLTILFLFWSITHLARKIVPKDASNMTTGEIITILGAGFVGALAYTFSDTFWFSAVEGEVYAFSSLFTAVVFWAILKWEDVADQSHAERWIIFIAYLMGLSIGVHLLNLLCIPALVLVYYFKKSSNVTTKGSLLALLGSAVLIAIVLYGIVPGFVKVASWFDLLFVNTLHFSYNSGAIFYILVVIAAISWGLYETFKGKNALRQKIAFCVNIVLVGIPFIGHSFIIWVLATGILIALVFTWKGLNAKLMNTVLLSLMVMLIGYSSYGVTVIRSNAQPPMDQNSPNNMFSLERYLNREQYGETPLLYGETFASDISWETEGRNCVPVYKKKQTLWNQVVKENPDQPDQYFISGYKEVPVMEPATNMLFPRMHSKREDHVKAYKEWSNFKGKPVVIDRCGRKETVMKPTMIENLRFFISYQVNFMYWRYFMWNFAGRQNDIQGNGEINNGNWITGIGFIDKALVGDQSNLPDEMANNKGRNTYYLLPLLLGLMGLFYQAFAGEKGIQGFWVTFFLFFMTGLAIVLYLNQTPYQPRERDYAYAGSFYAFCIWLGLGVPALIKGFRKFLPEVPAAALGTLLCLGVPTLMAAQNWDDHNRSDRTTARDFAYNYLMSCDENGVIFTNGDNDTFPLWYIQEVEGVRTDVRVCNLSYLQTDWYVDQMRRPYYESDALPIDWDRSLYANGKRDIARIMKLTEDSISLETALEWVKTDDPRYKRIPGYDQQLDFVPSDKIFIPVDKDKVLANGYVDSSYADKIVPQMMVNLAGKSYLGKHELMIMEMLKTNNWERPIYYAVTVEGSQFLGLKGSFLQEGLAYKVAPVQSANGEPSVNTTKMYDLMMNTFRWANVKDSTIYLDENNLRMCNTHRHMMASLAMALYNEGQYEKAEAVINKAMEELPTSSVPANYSIVDMAKVLYAMGKSQQAKDIIQVVANNSLQYLNWAYGFSPRQYRSANVMVNTHLFTLQEIMSVLNQYDKDLFNAYMPDFQKHGQLFQQNMSMAARMGRNR
ncbi:MAG: DUF2723 domain-containing protein [Bacteroidales bacterium]|nr:DUF2723 domain-containing protein [Bacteroidales bacterium]